MPVHNADIASMFEEIADLLESERANPFRIRAYRQTNEQLLRAMKDGRLRQRPGFGEKSELRILPMQTTKAQQQKRFKLLLSNTISISGLSYVSIN